MADTDTNTEGALATTNAGFDSAEGGTLKSATTAQAFKDSATKLGQQASDKARSYALDGKAKAGEALDEVSKMLHDAAATVDEKLGSQYGTYARSAAEAVSGFSDSLKAKEVDELIDDARALVRKSPAVAIGAAAAIGFVLVRLVQAGLDNSSPDGKA